MKPEKKNKIRIHFKGVQSDVWEHPADKVALRALKQVPGFDVALKSFFGATSEKSLKLMALGGSVRVNKKQFSRVHSPFQGVLQNIGP